MMNEQRGIYEGAVTPTELVNWAIGLTLDDQPVPRGSLIQMLVEVVKKRVGHDEDLRPLDIDVEYADHEWDRANGWFGIKVGWRAVCAQCGFTATQQNVYDEPLCLDHFLESMEQDRADLDNDDRAIGLLP